MTILASSSSSLSVTAGGGGGGGGGCIAVLARSCGQPSYQQPTASGTTRVGRMSKEEKRRKFHDALMNLYLPPQPLPHQQHPIQEPVDFECHGLCMDPLSEDNDLEKETSSDDAGKCAPQKLTRAQRKRIRKKKLKEAALQRRKIIGPLLPTHEDIQNETATKLSS